ncbi:MAG: leucine-rich repeat protein [Ruminococcus sp.]
MKNKRRHRLYACLLAAVMLMSMLCIAPYTASAADEETPVFTSGDYQYSLLDDGSAVIVNYTGSEAELTIPTELDGNSVTQIGSYSFENCTSIENLTIPDGITTIGENAFRFCSNIKTVSFPDELTAINNGSFSFCESLVQVTLPDSVTTIGDYAFQGCEAMTSIKLPNDLEILSSSLLTSCTSLTSIDIPASVKEIGQGALAHCYGLTSVTVPEGVTLIDGGAFSYCENLTSISLPDTLETVNGFAFSNCIKLMEITVPDSVIEINRLAFGYWFDLSVWNDMPLEGFVLKGYTGSAADRYAQEYGIKFESIGITQQPTTEATTAAPTEPPAPGTVVTVYYKNTNNFSTPYAYYWSKGGNGAVAWPGVAMTKVTDDVYKIDVPAENNMIIFSDNGANQTDDLDLGSNNQIYDGYWKDYEDAPTEPTTDAAEPTTGATEPTTGATEPTTKPESDLPDYLYGDVNEDGRVNVKDVTEIQKAAASIITLNDLQKAVADVNKDGSVNVKDATHIQKFLAGIVEEL